MMLSESLALARGDIEALSKDGNGHVNNYTTLPSILIAVNPILAKHKINFMIDVTDVDRTEKFTTYHFRVRISDGTTEDTYIFPIPEARVPRGKSQSDQDDVSKRIQDFGSTVTYGSRYIYGVLLGIPFADEDPDGSTGKITPEELTWWFNHVPIKSDISGDKLFEQLKLFVKGTINKESYKSRGIE